MGELSTMHSTQNYSGIILLLLLLLLNYARRFWSIYEVLFAALGTRDRNRIKLSPYSHFIIC